MPNIFTFKNLWDLSFYPTLPQIQIQLSFYNYLMTFSTIIKVFVSEYLVEILKVIFCKVFFDFFNFLNGTNYFQGI